MNQVTLIGRLVKDIDFRYNPQTGNAVANGILAIDRKMNKEKKEEMKQKGYPTADFPRIVAFGKIAEVLEKYTSKGSMVGVSGMIQTGKYEDKEKGTVYTTDVLVRELELLSRSEAKQTGQIEESGEYEEFGSLEDGDDIPF